MEQMAAAVDKDVFLLPCALMTILPDESNRIRQITPAIIFFPPGKVGGALGRVLARSPSAVPCYQTNHPVRNFSHAYSLLTIRYSFYYTSL